MKTITKKYKVYNYTELSKEAKEKVRGTFGEDDADFTTEQLKEDFAYKLQEDYPYFKEAVFAWSLSNCQGDGLSFSCDVDLEKFIDIKISKIRARDKAAILELIYNVLSVGNTGRYCYAARSDIEFEFNVTDKEYPKIEKKALEIIEKIKDYYITACTKLEKQGYNAYEYLYSDEYAKNTSEANEYTFLENGELFA